MAFVAGGFFESLRLVEIEKASYQPWLMQILPLKPKGFRPDLFLSGPSFPTTI